MNDMVEISSMDQVSSLITLHRKKAKLSRNNLALLAGVGKTLIYNLEHASHNVGFNAILRVLHVLNLKLCMISPLSAQLNPR